MPPLFTQVVRESDLFHPRRHPLDLWRTPAGEDGLRFEPVEMSAADGVPLRGWRVGAPACRRVCVYFYGNAETVLDSRDIVVWFARTFAVRVLVMDYRGYGFSEGTPGLDAFEADAVRVLDAGAAEAVAAGMPLFLYGHSLGAGVAVQAATRRSVAGVILEAPPTSAADVIPVWRRRYPWYLRWLMRVEPDLALRDRRPQPVDAIRGLRAPLLILHGGRDEMIPLDIGRRMYEAAGSERKQWCPVPEAGHSNTPTHPAALQAVRAFFDRV